MNNYKVNLGSILKPNVITRLYNTPQVKAPIKSEGFSVVKDNEGRTSYLFNKPQNVNIAGQKIKGIYNYSVVPFKDGATNNGKLYNLKTSRSDISLYTHDNKFASMFEYFKYPQTLKIGEYNLRGDLTKIIKADGSKEYQVITPNFKIKKINISPNGTIQGPKKSSFEIMKNNLFQAINKNKFISKLLKNLK